MCAARTRPIDQRVSSAGLPATVTDGVAFFAMIGGTPLAPARTRTIPVGAERRNSRAPFSRFHSASARPSGSSRSVHPSAARRTSSWCTKYSTVLAAASAPGIPNKDIVGGPALNSPISSSYEYRSR